jgi:hypothetical protein
MARVAALLSPYYDKSTPQGIREMEAEDWLVELRPYPQWAIERAVRWWKSAENERRARRPVEGDISARCKVEMRGFQSVPDLIRRGFRAGGPPPADPPRVSKEAAAAIMAAAGYGPRKMGGDDV